MFELIVYQRQGLVTFNAGKPRRVRATTPWQCDGRATRRNQCHGFSTITSACTPFQFSKRSRSTCRIKKHLRHRRRTTVRSSQVMQNNQTCLAWGEFARAPAAKLAASLSSSKPSVPRVGRIGSLRLVCSVSDRTDSQRGWIVIQLINCQFGSNVAKYQLHLLASRRQEVMHWNRMSSESPC